MAIKKVSQFDDPNAQVCYAFAHAPKGMTYVVRWLRSNPAIREIVRLKDDPMKFAGAKGKKILFISKVKPGDEVFLELGGVTDRLAFALLSLGAVVYRIPNYRLKDERVTSLLAEAKIDLGTEEKAMGEETSTVLTARKHRAFAIEVLATSDVDQFYRTDVRDANVLQIGQEFKSFRRAQKSLLRAYQGLLSSYRDQILIQLAQRRQMAAQLDEEALFNQTLLSVARLILGEANKTEIDDFMASVGQKLEGTRPSLTDEKGVKKLIEALLETDQAQATVASRLKVQLKRIEVLLKGGTLKSGLEGDKPQKLPPSFLWEQVFSKIARVGPITAAGLISAIGDIRRFPKRSSLTWYAGYAQNADGSRQRPRKGETDNKSRVLKQTVYQWTQSVLKAKPAECVWRQKLDSRRAYELWKILAMRQADADAKGVTDKLLPPAMLARNVPMSVVEILPGDLKLLSDHVDALRKKSGTFVGEETDDEEAEGLDDAENAAAIEETPSDLKEADKQLGRVMRGVKGSALNKALRWLGQQLICTVWQLWNQALGYKADRNTRSDHPVASTDTAAAAA